MSSYPQSYSVSINNMTVNNTNATLINFNANDIVVNVYFFVTVNTNVNPQDSYPGTLKVYYQKNSVIPIRSVTETLYFGGSNSASKSYQIKLNSNEFDNSGGFMYAEYISSSGISYKSNNVNITKTSTTNPTPADPATPAPTPNLSRITYNGSENTPYSINEGSLFYSIIGSDMGSDFTYQWYKRRSDFIGGVIAISGATGKDYLPVIEDFRLGYYLFYYRVANSKTKRSTSNSLDFNIIPAPAIQNNTINANGWIINGSLPTGGINSYKYLWVLWGGEEPYIFPSTGQSLELTEDIYNYLSWNPNLYVTRNVASGIKTTDSNSVTIVPVSLPVTSIGNNTISISGYQVTGSQPTGGVGNYTYSWFLSSQEDPIWFDETTKDLNLTPYSRAISILQTDPSAILFRQVRSIKTSNSNTINLYGASAKKSIASSNENADVDFVVYPNPTKEVLNFITNFSTNKEIEIFIYSENLGNEKSVFKGTVTPNQVINWRIPSNYQKGLYFYKIKSGREEIKTGKIIYQ